MITVCTLSVLAGAGEVSVLLTGVASLFDIVPPQAVINVGNSKRARIFMQTPQLPFAPHRPIYRLPLLYYRTRTTLLRSPEYQRTPSLAEHNDGRLGRRCLPDRGSC